MYLDDMVRSTVKAVESPQKRRARNTKSDEIEKAFGGMSGGGGDGGTSTRTFGSFLTWMNDHTEPVFVVATANDVSRLPPEMLRAGRFDAIEIGRPNSAS